MWQEQQAELLKNEIEALLTPLSKIDGLYDLVREPLTRARRGLAADITHDRPWPLLPLIVCEAIFGHFEHAVPAAAALRQPVADSGNHDLALGGPDAFRDGVGLGVLHARSLYPGRQPAPHAGLHSSRGPAGKRP